MVILKELLEGMVVGSGSDFIVIKKKKKRFFPKNHLLNKIPAYIPSGTKITTFITISPKSILPFKIKGSLKGIKFTSLFSI